MVSPLRPHHKVGLACATKITVKILIIRAFLFFVYYHFSCFSYAAMPLISSRTPARLTASDYSRIFPQGCLASLYHANSYKANDVSNFYKQTSWYLASGDTETTCIHS